MAEFLLQCNSGNIINKAYLDITKDNTEINYIKFFINYVIDELSCLKKVICKSGSKKELFNINKTERHIKKGKLYKKLKNENVESESDSEDSDIDFLSKIKKPLYNDKNYSEESVNESDEDDDIFNDYLDNNSDYDENRDDSFIKSKKENYPLEQIYAFADITLKDLINNTDEFKLFDSLLRQIQSLDLDFYSYITNISNTKKQMIEILRSFTKIKTKDNDLKVRKVMKIKRINN